MTMQLIATSTVGSGGASSIEFTSIPQDGTDLLLIMSLRNSVNFLGAGDGHINFNSDTGANYVARRLFGTGSSAGSSDLTASETSLRVLYVGDTATSNTFSSNMVHVSNYTLSQSKSVSVDNVTENNATAASQAILAGVYNQNAAITSIEIKSGFTWLANSTASLYKITKGSDGSTVVS
jgi:hypothetical protein